MNLIWYHEVGWNCGPTFNNIRFRMTAVGANKRHWHVFPGLKRNGCETLQGHHHRMGQVSPSLTPRVTRLCQTKANVASSRAPMPTGTIRKLQDMLLTTTTSGSMPAGGRNLPVRCIATIAKPTATAAAHGAGPHNFTNSGPTSA